MAVLSKTPAGRISGASSVSAPGGIQPCARRTTSALGSVSSTRSSRPRWRAARRRPSWSRPSPRPGAWVRSPPRTLTPDQDPRGVGRGPRARTDRPFGINLFAGGREARRVDPGPMLELLGRYHEELGLPAPAAPAEVADPFEGQLEAVLESRPRVFSFTFGIPDAGTLERLRERGIVTLGTATTVEERGAWRATPGSTWSPGQQEAEKPAGTGVHSPGRSSRP